MQKTTNNLFLVVVMLTTIFKSIGMAEAKGQAPLMPRQADISKNIVQFSMPENFSKDFPAKDMLEHVDLRDEKSFAEFDSIMLLQRWWDFNSGGVFKKTTGTVMMVVKIQKITSKNLKNISNPLEFAETITERLRNTYDSFNKTAKPGEKIIYSTDYSDFVEYIFNGQRWLRYSFMPESGGGPTVGYCIPIDIKHYLVVNFSSAPVRDMPLRQFISEYSQPHIDRIMASFRLIYSSENQFAKEIEKNQQLRLDEMRQNLPQGNQLEFKPMVD